MVLDANGTALAADFDRLAPSHIDATARRGDHLRQAVGPRAVYS